MHKIDLILGEYDWLSTRLSSRKFYPRKPKVSTGSYYVVKPHVIVLAGIEGIGVTVGRYKGQRSLIIHLAHSTPFVDSLLIFAKNHLATWNDVFNTWDIPVLSQNKTNALAEIWDKVDEAFFELPWSTIELHWHYSISEGNLQVLKKKINQLNNFWESGEVDYIPPEVNLVYQGFTQEKLEQEAIAHLQKIYPYQPKTQQGLERVCVNYLRHRCSAYHVLLETELPYLKVFRDVNGAIASSYPWLKDEALSQIERKVIETQKTHEARN